MIERISGYSNEMMVLYLELLLKTLQAKHEVSIGSGRNKRMETVFKYEQKPNIINPILESIDYYKSNPSMFEFRDYQVEIIDDAVEIIKQYGFVYLTMEVRTGKTLTSLGICSEIASNEVLFITKKKAIGSIEHDYKMLNPSYGLTAINYESLHKIPDKKWDVIICDEAHSMGAFPKPSKRAVDVKDLIKKTDAKVILLSGTPTPESYSQIYHQVYGIPNNPFSSYTNFYKFANQFVNKKQMKLHGFMVNDYSDGKPEIIDEMTPYTISYSQVEAGFIVETNEFTEYVDMKQSTYDLAKRLQKDLVVEGSQEVILADTAVKLMTKLHQIYSGTVKFESGKSMVLDTSKADYIAKRFEGKKLGIFYKFTAEFEALKKVFGDKIVSNLDDFCDNDKHIALQIVSGREGISLKEADALVYYNIDFSATSYWQSRDRMTTKDRKKNDIYWIFSKNGIEDKIYKAVTKKKNYTLRHFTKDLKLWK